MTELRRRMLEDLQLAGYAQKTQKSYIDAVQRLARYYNRSPDQLAEEEVRRFFLHLINERKSGRSTVTNRTQTSACPGNDSSSPGIGTESDGTKHPAFSGVQKSLKKAF